MAYFLQSMAYEFQRVAEEVSSYAEQPLEPEPPELQRLDRRARIILALFTQHETLTTTQMARALGLAPRTMRDLVVGWIEEGWLEIADPSRRTRRYRLSAVYRRFIGGLSAE